MKTAMKWEMMTKFEKLTVVCIAGIAIVFTVIAVIVGTREIYIAWGLSAIVGMVRIARIGWRYDERVRTGG